MQEKMRSREDFMKYIFIINPAAGQGKARSFWLPKIQKLVKERELPYELHNTLSFQEGVNYIRQRCETGEEIRFYGCGGDGTLPRSSSSPQAAPMTSASSVLSASRHMHAAPTAANGTPNGSSTRTSPASRHTAAA